VGDKGAWQSAVEIASSQTPRNDNVNATLKVYNILLREVTTPLNKHQKPGNYRVKFDVFFLSCNIYLYRLTTGKFTGIKKMILPRWDKIKLTLL